MPRHKDGYKVYKAGDPIHFVVTQEFADVANEFFTYCKEKGYNPSEIIRQAISEWYKRESSAEIAPGTSVPGLSLDDKLAQLVSQKVSSTPKKRALLSPKDVLEER